MSDSAESDLKCSFAVTGEKNAFQAIFVCHSCSKEDDLLCLCRACADCCHADHEGLEYMGMGPCFCDCRILETKCQLEQISREEADRLKIQQHGILDPSSLPPTLHDGDYIRDAFMIDALKDEQLCDLLRNEVSELIKHSKDTFWIDETCDSSQFTSLETLAWLVFRNHVKHYDLSGSNNKAYGAEWWVQVKSVTLPENAETILESTGNGSEAVDLHYDKDEALAESFGLGSFPALSTVTYLTDSVNAPPTVVFPHRYDEGDNEMMADMLVSRPRKGKHVVFDGRLLHGAPSHFALRPLEAKTDEDSSKSRITFLVNIWTTHKPAGVNVLSDKIRMAIKQSSLVLARGKEAVSAESLTDCCFESRPRTDVGLTDEADLPESLRSRIELPFLGKGTTWESGDDDERTVVVTFPPPPHEGDTLLVRFGPGLQAYLESVVEDEDAPDSYYKPELEIYV